MAQRDDLITHVDDLLDTTAYRDYCHNGMQVPGRTEVTSIATAVSANQWTIDEAVRIGADMLLTHHGLFWRPGAMALSQHMRDRIASLTAADLTLASWHLPLDGNTTFGNNALIAGHLGLEPTNTPFALVDGVPIGVLAHVSAGGTRRLSDLVESLQSATGQTPLVLEGGPSQIRTVAICSGGGGRYLEDAKTLGADVLVTGEPEEPAWALARELSISLVAGGHNATETFGIRALGEHLANAFHVTHTFIPENNPV
jgi:dinuclear metal center YbgI/SA1388 family protein